MIHDIYRSSEDFQEGFDVSISLSFYRYELIEQLREMYEAIKDDPDFERSDKYETFLQQGYVNDEYILKAIAQKLPSMIDDQFLSQLSYSISALDIH